MENMKWNHLPAPGGMYDQDPELLELWDIIFRERSAHQDREQKEDQRKRESEARKTKSLPRGRR